VLGILLALFFVQAFGTLFGKAPTFDEVLFIPSGYAFLKTGSMLSNPEAQPLPRILSAIPLLILNPRLPETEPQFQERYPWGARFLFENNRDQTARIVLAARLPVIALGLGLLLLIYTWSKSLFGPAAALISLGFAAIDPNLIAHSSLATSDLPFTFCFILTLFFYIRFCRVEGRISHVILTGVALAATLLCKTTGWLLFPILFVLVLVDSFPTKVGYRPGEVSATVGSRLIRFLGIAVIAILVVNLVFLFSGSFQDKREILNAVSPDQNRPLIRATVFFLPDEYAFAFVYNLSESSGSHHPFPFFLNGKYSIEGFWYYFFEALAIKTPLSVLLWTTVCLVIFFRRNPVRTSILHVIPWMFLLIYFSFFNKLNLGLRHILPVYPIWFILAGAPFQFGFRSPRRWITGILIVCLGWSFAAAARIYPYHLAYFNETIGGPSEGYRYLVDSNVDWGQDLIHLKRYLDERNINRVYLSYFGNADPQYYGLRYVYLPSPRFQPWTLRHPDSGKFVIEKGIYAISATNLQGVYLRDTNTFSAFKNRVPDARIGYSILIFQETALVTPNP
jgi:hypothetical protein